MNDFAIQAVQTSQQENYTFFLKQKDKEKNSPWRLSESTNNLQDAINWESTKNVIETNKLYQDLKSGK